MGNSSIYNKKGIVALFALYLSVLFFLSLYPFSSAPVDMSRYILGIRTDRIVHFIMFFPLPLFSGLVYELSKLKLKGRLGKYILVFFISLIIASLTEFLQSLTDFRDFDVLDLAANYLSVTSSSILLIPIDKFFFNDRTGRLQ
jgi:VanZ family protein